MTHPNNIPPKPNGLLFSIGMDVFARLTAQNIQEKQVEVPLIDSSLSLSV